MEEYSDKPKIYENKRVVLITGGQSKWYEQAIFIIKKNAPQENVPGDLIKEAEMIIDRYMSGVTYESTAKYKRPGLKSPAPQISRKRKASNFNFILNIVMLISCIVIFAVLAFQFMG